MEKQRGKINGARGKSNVGKENNYFIFAGV
jgi:hypothetical protein